MLALIALIAFILSPFVGHLAWWPMVTVGFIFLTAHFLWSVPAPWAWRRPPP